MAIRVIPSAPALRDGRPAAGTSVWRRYGDYLRRPPLLTLEWCDQETGARGWLVLNSLRGGAAGGGTRMRPGLGRREVVYLAKTMELKFLFSGPPIGGAKSGIDFDPADPRREGVLRRWFRAVAPQLRSCYGTGGDLNVDEVLDVIPRCAEVGLLHPQEGVVRGHLRPAPEALPAVFASLTGGVKAPVADAFGVEGLPLTVADLITGYGVARAIIHRRESRGESVRGARVLLEGFGAVGAPCALYLARAGARVVGIADRHQALVDDRGLDAAGVEHLLRARRDKCLPADDPRCLRGAERERFARVPADVFVAAAASETLDERRLEELERQGVGEIACGANQPFREAKLGATRVQRLADRRFAVIPDVIANCGMARAFSYLMEHPATADTAAPVFAAVDQTIGRALHDVAPAGAPAAGLLAATLGWALERLEAPAQG